MYPEKCDQEVVWISRSDKFYLQNVPHMAGDIRVVRK